MFSVPRIVAVDDELWHLDSLIKGLSQCGIGCLPIHYKSEMENVVACPHARVIFADLNLIPGTPRDHKIDFSVIGGLLTQKIRPTGPYMLILWTQYPEKAGELEEFLRERPFPSGVLKPFAINALDKAAYIDVPGDSSAIDADGLGKLVQDVESMVREESQIAALLTWEEHILYAAARTVNSVFELTESDDRPKGLSRLLTHMAIAGVGKERISDGEFQAVNEALFPILADRISFLRLEDSDYGDLWRHMLDLSDAVGQLCPETRAKLNRLVHIAAGGQGSERGAVNNWPSEQNLEESVGLQEAEAAKQFGYEGQEGVYSAAKAHWVLVQTQAICDYAQARKGALPFHLGLLMPQMDARKPEKCQNALWISPDFVVDGSGSIYRLHVSARYQFLLTRESAENTQVRFRLREQIVNEMIYRLHSYCARPGILQF